MSALWEPLSAARVARRDFEVARRKTHQRMARDGTAATPDEIDELHERWEVACAYYRVNEIEPAGWRELGLDEPQPWELHEAELLVAPVPIGSLDSSAASGDVAASDRTPLRPNLGDHSRATIKHAVELFLDRDKSSTALAMELSTPNATRLRRMVRAGLIDLNHNGEPGLWVDPRVGTREGGRIVLRYWDERSRDWVDPLHD
jgi:hypothetical protein